VSGTSNHDALSVFQGLIDPAKETEKLLKKKEFLLQQMTKLEQVIAAPGYEEKVPKDVQEANSDKLKQSQGEIEIITAALKNLATM